MLLLAGFSLLLTAAMVTGLICMVKHVPAFYLRADTSPGKDRNDLSKACFGRFLYLLAECWNDGRGEWEVTFSEAQINSYFEEDFIRHGIAEVLRKQGMTG